MIICNRFSYWFLNVLPNRPMAITLYPFMLISYYINDKSQMDILLNHEKIHLQQQKELAVIFFYLIYIAHFILLFFKYFKYDKAYRAIIFEREAYNNQHDLEYLDTRKPFAFIG